MKRFLSCIAVLVAVTSAAGCAARIPAARSAPPDIGTAPPAATATATVSTSSASPSPPTSVGSYPLTVADNGATVRLARGQSLTVALAAQGMFSWHIPIATGPALRPVHGSGGYPTGQPARATFLAVESGTATLTAMNDTACLHAPMPCLPAQREWRVTVLIGQS